MAENIHILAFSGSLRKGSFNTRLLHIAQTMLPEDTTFEIFDLTPIPLYNEDVRQQGYPAPVADFRSKIRAADALLIASPEYNYSVSGVLKNALDWGSRVELDEKPGSPSPFSGKPLGMVSVAGRSGGIRSQLALRQIAVFLNMFPINKPEVTITNFPPNLAFDKEGNLLDQAALGFLRDHLVALRDYARQLKK